MQPSSLEQRLDVVAAVCGLLTIMASVVWYKWYAAKIKHAIASGKLSPSEVQRKKRRLPLAFLAGAIGYAIWIIGKTRQH